MPSIWTDTPICMLQTPILNNRRPAGPASETGNERGTPDLAFKFSEDVNGFSESLPYKSLPVESPVVHRAIQVFVTRPCLSEKAPIMNFFTCFFSPAPRRGLAHAIPVLTPGKLLLAGLLLAAGNPALTHAQTPPARLNQNAYLYDTNYNAGLANPNYGSSGTPLVPPGINWQSLRGVPLNATTNRAAGSDGRGSVGKPATPNQFAGFTPFGGLAVSTGNSALNNKLPFSANVTNLNWPRLTAAGGGTPIAILRAAQVGGAPSAAWLTVPGTIISWGNDRAAQLDVPPGLSGVSALAAGDQHSLALTPDNYTITGWGSDGYGQIEPYSQAPLAYWYFGFLTPTPVLAAGGNHSLALAGGYTYPDLQYFGTRLLAFGDNGYGQCAVPAALSNNIAAFAAGFNHSLGVTYSSGQVFAWGDNRYGQTNVPDGLGYVVAVAGGQAHSLALLNDGTVVAWGAGTNNSGLNSQYGQSLVPANLSNIVAVAAGYYHSLALRVDGNVVAWGNNGSGQCNVPFGLTNVVALAAGSSHSLALRSDGTVVAWGNPAYASANFAAGLTRVSALAAGGSHSLALVGTGAPVLAAQPFSQQVPAGGTAFFAARAAGVGPLQYQWYRNGRALTGATNSLLTLANLTPANQDYYQVVARNPLGSAVSDNTAFLTVQTAPFFTLQPTVPANLVAGTNLVLTATAAGTAPLFYQWQYNGTNLTDGDRVSGSATTTLTVANLGPNDSGSYQLVATNFLGFATSSAATFNVFLPPAEVGQLPDQAPTIGSPLNWTMQVTGTGPFTYAWTLNGVPLPGQTNATLSLDSVTAAQAGIYTVTARNPFGLSITDTAVLSLVVAWGDDTSGQSEVPPGLLSASAVAAGDAHTLVAQLDGSVTGWGADDYGQIDIPTGLTNAIALAAGGNHSLALGLDGTIWGWGDDGYGQIDIPPGITNAFMLAAGFNHSLAATGDGRALAWGANQSGQTNVPVGLSNVVAVAGGALHSLALQNGRVWAWGANQYGQTNVPAAVTNSAAIAIAAGYHHNLALLTNGTVVAWGANLYGQTNVPAGLSNVVAISAGAEHSLAVRNDGTMVVWGNSALTLPGFTAGFTNVLRFAAGGYHSVAVIGGGRPAQLPVPFANQLLLPGESFTWSSPAYGTPTPTVQWYFTPPGGTPVALGTRTNSTLSLANIGSANAGRYQIVASNFYGNATNQATLTLATIAVQPADLTLLDGGTASFGVVVSNVSSLSYQWSINGIPILGATRQNFTKAPVHDYSYNPNPALTGNDGGLYSVAVMHGSGGLLNSSKARLTINVPMQFYSKPIDYYSHTNTGTYTAGQTAAAYPYAEVFGTASGFSAQWFLNDSPLPGYATNYSPTVGLFGSPAVNSTVGKWYVYEQILIPQDFNAGKYTVLLTNITGANNALFLDTNNAVYIKIIVPLTSGGTTNYAPPAFALPPPSLTTNSGENVKLSVSVVPAVSAPPYNTITYQWYKGPNPALGVQRDARGVMQVVPGTNSTLDLGYVTTNSSGNYYVVIQQLDVKLASSIAQLTVNPVIAQAGKAIPWPTTVDLRQARVGGPPLVPTGAAIWNVDKTNYYASGNYGTAVITWLDSATNAITEEVQINNPDAVQVALGQAVPVPEWADATQIPASGPHVDTQGDPRTILFWHAATHKLYATAWGSAKVYWPVAGASGSSLAVPQLVQTAWPADAQFQTYVAGSNPVDLGSPGNGFTFFQLLDQTPGMGASANLVQSHGQFLATNAGKALLLLAPATPSTTTNLYFQFVQSQVWTNLPYLTASAVIGRTMTNFPGHASRYGLPYVFNPLSRYCAAAGFLDRLARTGSIVPVNTAVPFSDRDLVLVYYQPSTNLFAADSGQVSTNNPIGWPALPARFDAQWPADAPPVAVANAAGTGAIDPAVYLNWQLYVQNDPALPGFNPNDEHALVLPVGNGSGVVPIRYDLGTTNTSLPYVLVNYQDTNGIGGMKVWHVVAPVGGLPQTPAVAGSPLQPPFPLSVLPLSAASFSSAGPAWQDRKGGFWAKAAGDDGISTANIVANYYYPVQVGFYFPSNYFAGTPLAQPGNFLPVGTSVPWLGRATPVPYTYVISWPTNAPFLNIGNTLVGAQAAYQLPAVDDPAAPSTSVEILYQQSVAQFGASHVSVKLIDGTGPRQAPLAALPAGMTTSFSSGLYYFTTLPPDLRSRVWYDPIARQLNFVGQYVTKDNSGANLTVPYLLLNVLTAPQVAALQSQSSVPAWTTAVNKLATLSATTTEVVPEQPFNHPLALSTGAGAGSGFVTLAYGYSTNLNNAADPVSLQVIQVGCPSYPGVVELIQSANPFDESISLRLSADFAGLESQYRFQWLYHAPGAGVSPTPPANYEANAEGWVLHSTGIGAVEITIAGANLLTLSDNFYICRYQPINAANVCGTNQSTWTPSQFVPGWVSRVLAGTDPLNQDLSSYTTSTNNTIVSMLALAGAPARGLIPLDGAAAGNLGLIELYTSVFARAQSLSINGAPPVNYGPANTALLNTAGSLSDLFLLLGNEAYAEASDPTVTIPASANIPAVQAASIHVFEGQTATRLEEELKLLRGRDDTADPPVTTFPFYNRLLWNFTGQGANNNGQVAYGNEFGVYNIADAQARFPMGHGDAWGHYLSAVSYYYQLLGNPNFSWQAAAQDELVGGIAVTVDYGNERNFVAAAAARARTGADIVNLTYRSAFAEDPNGQWQNSLDSNTNRAWGVAEWGSRAGQAALFDWIVGNGFLPAESTNTGVQKIDRTTVTELGSIAASYTQIQTEVDKDDRGLSPLGLAKNVIPFDVEPSQGAGTHFEQIYARAVGAVNNALALFNLASGSRQALLGQADSLAAFNNTVQSQEQNFNNQLIQAFGYPYSKDIGAGGTYPAGYSGPDLFHYMYYDPTQILGVAPPNSVTFFATNATITVGNDGTLHTNLVPVSYNLATNGYYGLPIPASWTGDLRHAPGSIQLAQSALLQSRATFAGAILGYENLIIQIEDSAGLLKSQYNVNAQTINIMNAGLNTLKTLNQQISDNQAAQLDFQLQSQVANQIASGLADALPKLLGFEAGFSVGTTIDPTFFIRGAILAAAAAFTDLNGLSANQAAIAQLDEQQAEQVAQNVDTLQITTLNQNQAVNSQLKQLQELLRSEATARVQLYQLQEALHQAEGQYLAAISAGQQILASRLLFRQQTASQVQELRYKDMGYRTFQTDALQKYRSAYDLAATYVYLAAAAYDYDTALGQDDPNGPGSLFMTAIVKARSIGQISNGQPVAGSSANGDDPGLADPMARMYQNYQQLKSSLGLNNPDPATLQFSLRSENFRISQGSAGRTNWQNQLAVCVVTNLLTIPEFQRYCIPPSPLQATEPGIVITFSTTVGFGQNLFGWPLGGGDSSYDSSHFATKIASEGVWFNNYNATALQHTPSVYLIPVGIDFLRTPGEDGGTRQWKIAEQIIPVPFPLANTSLSATNWIPINDTLGNQYYAIRRYSALQAYNDGGYQQSQVTSSSRLVGRSVWNTKWMLIIPAGALLGDRTEALQRFIYGALLDPNGPVTGPRDGNGVSDIKISFQTLSYPGY